jgi:UDP-2,3-diacylglucosamine hydrolase
VAALVAPATGDLSALFVSDLHLDPGQPEVTAQFLELLAGRARRAPALYVLGDLFEAWLGDDDPCPEYRPVIAAFRALSDSGVALYFMHGNRDFLLGARFAAATGGSLLADPTIATCDGQRMLLTHGDALCTDDVGYQKLRGIVRDPEWQARFLALGLPARRTLVRQARAASREHTAAPQTMLMDVNQGAVEAAFRRADVDLIIHGHTHRPAVHRFALDGRARTRAVLGDWHRSGSCIELTAQGPELLELERGSQAVGGGPE